MKPAIQNIAVLLSILPMIRYEFLQAEIKSCESFFEHLAYQGELFEGVSSAFLLHDKLNSTGMRALNSAWQLAKSSNADDSVRASKFVGFIEGKLGVGVPIEFEQFFIGGTTTKLQDFRPDDKAHAALSLAFVVKLSNENSIVITPPESIFNGKLEFYHGDTQTWEAQLWAAFADSFGRSVVDAVLIQPVMSPDGSSMYLFAVYRGAFTIAHFRIADGKRIGSFITRQPIAPSSFKNN